MDRIILGRCGIEVSRLNIGTGTNGWGHRSKQTALGIDGLADILKAGYDRGVTFWDTADEYGSHPHIARALKDVPRSDIVITTKTTARNGKRIKQDIERFLKELATDYLDIVLLHFLTDPAWRTTCADAMNALSHAKEAGKVRAVGISSHSLGALQAADDCDWVDVVLARINYAGTKMDAPNDEVVPVLRSLYAQNKGVYGMKVYGCGELVSQPTRALDYVFGLGCVHAVTVGTSNHVELDENIALVNEISPKYPLA